MPLPQVIVRRGDRGAAPFPADDVSTRFEAVVTERGPVGQAVECRSFAQVRDLFGGHTSTSTLRAVEAYFAEGGGRAVLSRVVGTDSVNASLNLSGATTGVVLKVSAVGSGPWYHGVRVRVEGNTGNDRRITLTLNDALLVSGTVSDVAGAIALINSSGLATAGVPRTDVAAWPPREIPTATALAGGDDDITSVSALTAAEIGAALDVFDEDLGAGSVCASAWDDRTVFEALADHAAANNRFARGDFGPNADVETMRTTAEYIRGRANARHIQLLAGWLNVSVAGVSVPVAPSGVHLGREAQADRENGAGPAQPAAWTFGEYRTPIGLVRPFTRTERETLNSAGITVITQDAQGAIYAEDAITAVDGTRYPQYAEVAAMRVTMAIHAQAKQVLHQRVMQTIDGQGHLAAATTGDLVAICADWYARGALYGADAAEAFSASVVAETEAGQKPRLVGYLALRPSPSAHTVELTITQVAPSDTI
ncbi:hypothetical protein VSS74_25165 [Conexibacter stalactiti]|uniref:Tail sheath protein n=1 Tax=Conexibacter stalactiti TaxID=1940611 RepID=A0ABU4HWG5_9ACTN|nr:hypothetical protein [Conexibacter stalactiti]MDW5597666.1 hypothetical protein [Conexibacter stalactiti]MEC5038308.1 hypothetical protein [Conexibacter stalactiti]